MKKVGMLTVLISALIFCCWGGAQAQPIENELYLITPVSKDVHDPVLKEKALRANRIAAIAITAMWTLAIMLIAAPK